MKHKHYLITFLLTLLCSFYAVAQNTTGYLYEYNIPYKSQSKDVYEQSRCKLDVYYPKNVKNFSTIVWFHGGGLEGGEKFFPKELLDKGVAIIAVNYRLSPKATNPAYTDDAAAAVAWTFNHIQQYGGNTKQVFVSGHSAGGYLTLMLGLDKSYLAKYNIDADSVAAYFPISGQTTTHYTIRKERGLPLDLPIIDNYAPSNHARKDASPFVLITGDRDLEMSARYEENAHLAAVLKALGHKQTELYELKGFDHGTVVAPACYLIIDHIKKYSKMK
ncbi:MAG: nlhH 1 [Bacteroidetes bacterium]|nr:nlhH 1 [Bacteroidota bacterium]